MEQLNFKHYPITLKNRENKRYIFDVVRKKDILLTPEEWVRQHCLHYLLSEKNYPIGLINVEKKLKVYGRDKRYDIIIYTPQGEVTLLVECKAPHVPIDQAVFDQIARYNLSANSQFLMVTNGLTHVFCQMDYAAKTYHYLADLPAYTPCK